MREARQGLSSRERRRPGRLDGSNRSDVALHLQQADRLVERRLEPLAEQLQHTCSTQFDPRAVGERVRRRENGRSARCLCRGLLRVTFQGGCLCRNQVNERLHEPVVGRGARGRLVDERPGIAGRGLDEQICELHQRRRQIRVVAGCRQPPAPLDEVGVDELGIAPSVGSRGDAYDNAMAEAWVATYKTELVDGRRFPSFEHVEHETLAWIAFYNHERLHEYLGDIPPAEHEDLHEEKGEDREERPSGPPTCETETSIETNLSAR